MGYLGIGRVLATRLSTGVRMGAQLYRSTSGGNGYFNPEEWESTYPDILDDATYKSGNPGQDTILNEYWIQAAQEFCEQYDDYDEGFSKDDFSYYIEGEIGDDKYNAVSEITDETGWELEQAYSEAGGKTSSSALNYTLGGVIAASVMAKADADVKAASAIQSKALTKIATQKVTTLSKVFYKMDHSSSFNSAFRAAMGNKKAINRLKIEIQAGKYGPWPSDSAVRSWQAARVRARVTKYKDRVRQDALKQINNAKKSLA